MKTAKQILLEAAKFLSKPGCWTKGTYGNWGVWEGRNIEGHKCCTVGALARVANCKPVNIEGKVSDDNQAEAGRIAGNLLRFTIKCASITTWNDSQESAKPVVAALRKAAKLL